MQSLWTSVTMHEFSSWVGEGPRAAYSEKNIANVRRLSCSSFAFVTAREANSVFIPSRVLWLSRLRDLLPQNA
jgi:hypothetical protein